MGRLHATAVSIGDLGVLIKGPSGSGKSDLALRLIDRGHTLVADDQVLVDFDLMMKAPEQLAGFLEVRGLGIVPMDHMETQKLDLVVELVEREDVPRLPEPFFTTICDQKIPSLRINAFELSSPIKIELACDQIDVLGKLTDLKS